MSYTLPHTDRTAPTSRPRSSATFVRTPFALLLALMALMLVPAGAAAAPTISEFVTGSGPLDAAAGPDGNVWFVESSANKIGRVTPSGVVTEFSSNLSSNAGLARITAGPDGNLWFTEANADAIGRITPAGVITEFGIANNRAPIGITAGPDGNLWFTEWAGNRVGRITPAGVVTEFATGIRANSNPWGIAAGADGNLWFTHRDSTGGVGRITTAGVVTEFGPTSGSVSGIAAGPDGNMWVAVSTDPGSIARVSLTGTITEFSAGLTPNRGPRDIVAGNNGNLYFTENNNNGALGQITTAGVISEFGTGLTGEPWGITTGADGNVWFTENNNSRVGRLTIAPSAVTNAPSTVSPTGATLSGTVGANSQATTFHFDWGLTSAYGSSTAEASAGSALTQAVTAPLTALAAASTYHYRVVATNASGTTAGQDQVFVTPPAPPAAPVDELPPATRPVLGRSATLSPVSGVVLVQLRGAARYLALSRASTVPVGSTIDATKGTVRLTTVRDRSGKLQSGSFWGGAFRVSQTLRKRANTVLTLASPNCSKARRHTASSAASPTSARHLWARDNHGRFVTRGRSAVATVRGTLWFMRETCAGTLVKVTRGAVSVRDLVRHRTVLVSAGGSYLARRR